MHKLQVCPICGTHATLVQRLMSGAEFAQFAIKIDSPDFDTTLINIAEVV